MTDIKKAAEAETEATAVIDHDKGNGSEKSAGDKGNGAKKDTSDKGSPDKATTDKNGVSSKVWMGTAVGVGSAALVAALMYAKRRK